jgi:hypothetical protein
LLNQYADYLYNNANANTYGNVKEILLQFAINDERETIKIASVRKLNQIKEDVKSKKLLIENGNIDELIKALETDLQTIFANEKNPKAIAEYKRVGWMK